MPKSDHLSDFELYVMLAVAALGDERLRRHHFRRITERTDRDVSIGAVYATLGRLSDKGFVAFTLSEPVPVRADGRASSSR